jgi:two-component system, OmpR family, copper resistance phosphate regulon response regulator CusR
MTTNSGKKICVIDDDPFLLDMYNLKFTQGGYTLSCFTDSSKALDELRVHGGEYAAVILDLIMPHLDGYGVLQTIREENLCGPHTALIVLSNQGQDTDIARAEQFTIDGYLIKASTLPSEVLAYVEKVVREKTNG